MVMNAPLIQPLYNEVQHGTWSTLYRRQRENLEDKGARLYLDALDEMEDVAALTAPKTLEQATRWGYVEARRFLLMEGAQTRKPSTALLERNIVGHHLHDITRLADFIDLMV